MGNKGHRVLWFHHAGIIFVAPSSFPISAMCHPNYGLPIPLRRKWRVQNTAVECYRMCGRRRADACDASRSPKAGLAHTNDSPGDMNQKKKLKNCRASVRALLPTRPQGAHWKESSEGSSRLHRQEWSSPTSFCCRSIRADCIERHAW